MSTQVRAAVTAEEGSARPAPGLLRSAGVYGLSNILQRAIPVLLLPILTFYLSAADVGTIALFTAAVGVASPLVGINISYAVRRRYFTPGLDFKTYVANCLGLLTIGTLLGLLVVWLAGPVLANVSGLPVTWLVLAILVASLQEFMMVPLTIWQVEQRPELYAWVQVGRSAVVAALTALFVIAFGWGWQGAAAAMLVSTAAFSAIVGIPALRRSVHLRYDKDDALHALRFGGGLIPHTLGSMGLQTFDRFVIAYYIGAAENGLYSVGFQIGLLVSLVADAFNRAWSPWLYEGLSLDNDARNRRIVRLTYLYFAGIAGVALGLSLVAPLVIPYVLAPEFHSAGRFVWWIALGFAFNGMYMVVSGFVFYSERTWIVSWITGISALFSVALNFLLVPRFGAIGAAQAAAAAFLLKFLLTWMTAARLRPMPWRLAHET